MIVILFLFFFLGLNDIDLEEAAASPDRAKETVEIILARHLEAFTMGTPERPLEEPENRSDRQAALACALATFFKINGVKATGKDGTYLVDKWPLFVQKDKSKYVYTREPF